MRSKLGAGTASDVHTVQAAAAVAELGKRLVAARSDFSHVVHLTVYLDDVARFPQIERVLLKAFGKWRPALTVLEVPAPAPVRGARVSLTAIGWLGQEKPKAMS